MRKGGGMRKMSIALWLFRKDGLPKWMFITLICEENGKKDSRFLYFGAVCPLYGESWPSVLSVGVNIARITAVQKPQALFTDGETHFKALTCHTSQGFIELKCGFIINWKQVESTFLTLGGQTNVWLTNEIKTSDSIPVSTSSALGSRSTSILFWRIYVFCTVCIMYVLWIKDEYTLELARLLPEFFLGSKEAADSSDYFQIFQAPKVIEEEGRGLNVCSDPQIAESDCKQKTGKCPSLRVWRWPQPAKLKMSCEQMCRWATRWPRRGWWRRLSRWGREFFLTQSNNRAG